MRVLTDDFVAPAPALPAQHVLWRSFAALAHEIEEHIAVEKDVLLPRAEAGEDPYHRHQRIPEASMVC